MTCNNVNNALKSFKIKKMYCETIILCLDNTCILMIQFEENVFVDFTNGNPFCVVQI